MKRMNWTAWILISGLFLASCGGGDQENTEMTDTIVTETPLPAIEETPAVPDTVNGIDTTVKVQVTEPPGVGKPDAQLGK
jgi:multidrug efflux pump subunit AcrA (membrane-fusion protein)